MAGEVPVLGQPQQTNNPLVVLNAHLGEITRVLNTIANPLPHKYSLEVANDAGGHGKMWGAFCMACSYREETYVYPCQVNPEEQLKPPQFFTIGDVFIIDEVGRMAKYEPPKS